MKLVFLMSLVILTASLDADADNSIPNGPITTFSEDISKEFVILASYGYCEKAKMDSGNCCRATLPKTYTVQLTGQLTVPVNYTFAILSNDDLKRIVVTTTGTKSFKQLIDQLMSLLDLKPFGQSSKKMKAYGYFYNVFLQVKDIVYPKLKELVSKYKDYQVIFTGHSLGGALATLLSVDSVLSNIVPKTVSSPALITYGCPRAGNYYLAQWVMFSVPVIFRIVRDRDIVASLPPCTRKFVVTPCYNSVNQDKFYTDPVSFEKLSLPEDSNMWHDGGLMLFDKDMKGYNNCGVEYGDNNQNKGCMPFKDVIDIYYHTIYHNIEIGQYCSAGDHLSE